MKWIAVAGLSLAFAGCAKFPANPVGQEFRRLIFRLRVAGEIRPDYLYFVAIRTSRDANPDANGPVPVITFPNANGFVAGQPTHFVQYDPTLSRPFIIRRFVKSSEEPNPPDPNSPVDLTKWTDIGVPISYSDVPPGTRELVFEISLNQIADSVDEAGQLLSLQVNFLTMNRLLTTDTSNRVYDALGDTRSINEINDYVRIPLTTSRVYDNQFFNFLEPTSDSPANTDSPDPDLDIVDWSVEVRTP